MAWIRSHKKGSGGGVSGFPILSGTSDPTSSQGNDGQEYLKYGNYVYKSFYDGAIVVRENTDDSTDVKLFVNGLSRSNTDLIVISDSDLLSYLTDITSGKFKGCDCYSQDKTTQYAFLIQKSNNDTVMNLCNSSISARITGPVYGGMVDLNKAPVTSAYDYQLNGYQVIGAMANKQVNNALLKKNNSWQNLIGSDLDDITLAVGGVNILSGTSDPTSSQGINGQIYLKYVDYEEDYTFKEYLEVGSTAGPYLDTGVYFKSSQEYEAKIQMFDTQTNNTVHFGCWVSGKDTMIYYYNSKIGFLVGGSGAAHTITLDNNAHIYKATQSGLLMDGSSVGNAPNWSNVPTTAKYYMFKDTAHNGAINTRIYYTKIWDNGELVAHFIPAERNSDNVYGMLNLVDGTFLTNVGSGSFSVGSTAPSVNAKPIISQFIKINGVWQALEMSDITDVILNGGETSPITYKVFAKFKDNGIILPYTLNADYKVSVTFYEGIYHDDTCILGNTSSASYSNLTEYSNQFYTSNGSSLVVLTSWSGLVDHTFITNNGNSHNELDGVELTSYEPTTNNNIHYCIGCRDGSSTSIAYKGCIKSYKIEKISDGSVVCSLRPADMNGLPCLYDEVNKVIYTAPGLRTSDTDPFE